MKLEATNLGLDGGRAFCMAFIFTKKGTVLLTGSLGRIKEHTKYWEPAHGIIHEYHINAIKKSWDLFGRCHLRLDNSGQLSARRGWQRYWLNTHVKSWGNHTYWILYDVGEKRVYGHWRRLPSTYLDELDQYHYRPEPEVERRRPRPLRGGLDL